MDVAPGRSWKVVWLDDEASDIFTLTVVTDGPVFVRYFMKPFFDDGKVDCKLYVPSLDDE